MVTISESAASRLHALIAGEPDADQLGMRINVTTTGCSSYAYSIALTEKSKQEEEITVAGIRFFYRQDELSLLTGIVIDVNQKTGRFSIYHPHPPQAGCPM